MLVQAFNKIASAFAQFLLPRLFRNTGVFTLKAQGQKDVDGRDTKSGMMSNGSDDLLQGDASWLALTARLRPALRGEAGS